MPASTKEGLTLVKHRLKEDKHLPRCCSKEEVELGFEPRSP